MGDVETKPHPAKFSKEVLGAARDWITWESDRLGGPLTIFDPFAGTGRVHRLADEGHEITAVELEPEWAAHHPDTIVGNILDLPDEIQGKRFDVLFTSPCYGNRMADSHEAKDACKKCNGTGAVQIAENVKGLKVCPTCKGTKLSRRNTYTHQMGRKLHKDNSGTLQWGPKYRAFHMQAWDKVHANLWIVNLSNHIRNGQEQLVTEWHLATLLNDFGLKLVAVEPVQTQRNRQGENGDLRVENEFLLVLRDPQSG